MNDIDLGEIRMDDPALIEHATQVAIALNDPGIATFHYAAFGTGWRMTAIDKDALAGGSVYGRGPSGLGGPGDEYTLWLRERSDNVTAGPWLRTGQLHVPDYLAEKFDCNVVDGYGIGVLILVVDTLRMNGLIGEAESTIRVWAEQINALRSPLGGVADALPAFIENPTKERT